MANWTEFVYNWTWYFISSQNKFNMTDQELSKIALKEAIKFAKIRTKGGTIYGTDDVIGIATKFYQFLKQG
jgi:hypothetical protein